MAASVGNAVGAVGAIKKGKEGKRMQGEAQAAIDNFEWQELNNPFNDLQVSTRSADLQREENARFNAQAMNMLGGSGARGVLGGIGGLTQNSTTMNRQIGANLDEQQKAINFSAAQDQTRIRGMQEKRQAEELQGYGQMLDVGRSMRYQSYADLMNIGNQQSEHGMSLMSSFMGGGMLGGMMGGGGGGMMGGGGGSQYNSAAGMGSVMSGNRYSNSRWG
ncbi:hypothetical protein [Aquimarina algiphila]|uniref:Uncharacterized protein n=1 Tax=Aquimarina algiphila TaxID=2047982 RepID=A0A554VRL0_9FLAO|nr:hypothetical protein [Aquimarina algiphila]TSE11271.1 hypothetical protein FOF46_01185 [Aquimarina algiphila]